MALNIPNVPYDASPVLTAIGKQNALTEQALNNKIKAAQAAYAPQTAYADVLSKTAYANYLPYQIQATALTNPAFLLANKDNPQGITNALQQFTQNFPKPGQLTSGVNLPLPNQQPNLSNGLLGLFLNKLLSNPVDNKANAISMAPTSANIPLNSINRISDTSDLVPGAQDIGSGAIAKSLAPYQTEVQKPGSTFVTPQGKIISSPTEPTRTTTQQSLIGIKNAIPLLKDIAEQGRPFLETGGKLKLIGSQLAGLISQFGGMDIPEPILKELGLNRQMISNYARWRSNIEKVPETLIKALALPQDQVALNKLSKIVEPLSGETSEGYANRVIEEAKNLSEERLPTYQNVLKGGLPLSQESNQWIKMRKPDGKLVEVSPKSLDEALKAKYVRVE